jgi:hypothetical protein
MASDVLACKISVTFARAHHLTRQTVATEAFSLPCLVSRFSVRDSFPSLLLPINEGLIVFSPLHYFLYFNTSTPVAGTEGVVFKLNKTLSEVCIFCKKSLYIELLCTSHLYLKLWIKKKWQIINFF